jgi:hypothetical protein
VRLRGVEQLGYARFFALTTALALPGLLLIPVVRPFVEQLRARDDQAHDVAD